MQKIGILTALVIWFVLAGKLLSGNMDTAVDVADIFEENDFQNFDANVIGFGKYGVTYLSEEEKSEILTQIAAGMGIEREYNIETRDEENTSETILTKSSKYADTSIRVISVTQDYGTYYETTQYVEISLDLKDNLECASSYRDLIEEIFTAEEIDGNVMINFKGTVQGALNYEEKNNIANKMLDNLDADIVSENRESDLFTIYAYSDKVSDSVLCGGHKVNINIAEEYNEIDNETVIYLSTPINNLDY